MTLKEFAALPPEARKAWLDSAEHWHNCAAHNEGQECCLEKLDRDVQASDMSPDRKAVKE